MPISGKTLELLNKLTALSCCPSCGKRSVEIESLSSCGHFLCANCVNNFVINSDNKCPKCYAINRRNDCREDQFVNNFAKICHKLNKFVNKETTDKSEPKVKSHQLVNKSKLLSKKVKSDKELNCHKSLAKESKSKSSSSITKTCSSSTAIEKSVKTSKMMEKKQKSDTEVDEDILSIPDSFDNDLFTQTSRTADNTELVSVILEGLESNSDLNNTEDGSGDKALKTPNSASNMADIEVQTSQRMGSINDISIQCEVEQKDNSVQTDKLLNTTPPAVTTTVENRDSSECCHSNCCFHKFLDTIPCNSLKTFLRNLIELKDFPSDGEQTLRESVAAITASNEVTTVESTNTKSKCEESVKSEEQISSFDLIQTTSSLDSIPSSIPSEIVTKGVKKQTKAKREDCHQSIGGKRTASVLSNDNKKLKSFDTTDEEMEVIQTKEYKPQEPKVVIQIDSASTSTTQSNAAEEEVKSKPRVKGPKSRQKAVVKPSVDQTFIEDKDEEPKAKRKPRKRYVSSDEETDEVSDSEKSVKMSETVVEEKNKTKVNRKAAQNRRNSRKPSIAESTTDDTTLVEDKPRKQTTKRTVGSKAMKKYNVEQLAEGLAHKSTDKSEGVYLFTDEEKGEQNEDKPKLTKRKSVPKKRFAIEESQKTDSDLENKTMNSKKSKTIVEKASDVLLEVSAAKVAKYKPKPKSKQKDVMTEPDVVFKKPLKAPPSPAPSITLSEISTSSSSSSRCRTSSAERSKKVILFSGLDEKQKKKVENLCRQLDAEAVNDWSDKVTHLVIALAEGVPKKDMICPRNAKYVKALLNNMWIVSYDWIVDSSRSDRFLDETNYEIKADKTATERGLPHISRTSGQKLFSKRMVRFEGDFKKLLSDFKDFVRIGGGIVIESEEEYDKKKKKSGCEKLVIVTEAVGLPTQKDGTKYVSSKEFMASISNFTPL